MRKYRKLIVSVAVLIMVAGLAGGISVAVAMAGGPKERPFKATQQGTFVIFDDLSTGIDDDCAFLTLTPGETHCSITLEGSGDATHMGAYTEVANWLNPVNLADACGEISSGDVVLTAANGDELHAEPVAGVASICLTGPPDENGVAPGVITDAPFSVTGGTGRFEGASGTYVRTGTFEYSLPTAEGTFDVTYEGTIAY